MVSKNCIILLCIFFVFPVTIALADAGKVEFVNQTDKTFIVIDSANKKTAQALGLPATLQNEMDQYFYITLMNSDVGKQVEYQSENGKYHFSISVKSMQNYINHHAVKKNIEYLSVDWKNILTSAHVGYVLPLFWKDNNGSINQQVRVDAKNNAVIGLFSKSPLNAITIMSYNTDKDETGSDHNSKYNDINDILSLFQAGRLPVPDVLLIQEGLGLKNLEAYKKALSQLVPGNWHGYYATEGDRPDSNIILISPKYASKNIKAGTLVFQNQSGWGLVGKRNAIYVDISMADILSAPIPGKLRVFNTHLESGRGVDIFFHAAKVRYSQFNEILHYPKLGVVQTVLGGDFNTMPIFDETTGLTHYQIGNLLSVFDRYLGNPSINWGQPITCTWSTCSKYTLHVGMWLDRFLLGSLSMPDYKVQVLYPYVDHDVGGYSDHLPVWFTLYYAKKY